VKTLVCFFILTSVACSHSPKVTKEFKKMRQKREIASTGIVGWAKDKFIETTAENEDAAFIKLENLKRELDTVEEYSDMFINTSDLNAFGEMFYVLDQFLSKYKEIKNFATDRSKVVHSGKFAEALEEATGHVEKAVFHLVINNIKPSRSHNLSIFRANEKLSKEHSRLSLESSYESKYINLVAAAKTAEAEMKQRKAWFFW